MKQSLIFILLLVVSCFSFADEYSDALDAEADGTTVDKKTEEINKAAIKAQQDWSFSAQSLLEGLPSDLPKKQFEAALKKLYFGSYIFYSKLKPAQSELIYKKYTDGMEIDKLRSLITEKYKRNF